MLCRPQICRKLPPLPNCDRRSFAGNARHRLEIDKAEGGILANAVYRTTKTVITNYWAKEIVGWVFIELNQIASKVQLGRHSIVEEKSVVVLAGDQLLRVSANGVQPVSNAYDYFIMPVGKRWQYQKLTPEQRQQAAAKFKRLLADSQATKPEGQMGFALALTCFPFIRSWLTTRPIFPHQSNEGGEGKSFGADRFAYLLYGDSGLKTSTQAAARRAAEPLVIYDDTDDMPTWLQLHMKRAATGIHHSSVGKGFEVEDSEQGDSINAFTSIKIPKDNPLLTRCWPRTYSKKLFKQEFAAESCIRGEIIESRDLLLSFVLDVIAEAMRGDEPDLSAYKDLPYPRTHEAHKWLLRLLRAFDRLAPGVIQPEQEFAGFLGALRVEEATTKSVVTDELMLLDQVLEALENSQYGSDDAAEGLRFEDGCIIASATAISAKFNKLAKAQGLRLRNFNRVNVGKWLAGEVNSSTDFFAEQVTSGTGKSKRTLWRIGRKPELPTDQTQGKMGKIG